MTEWLLPAIDQRICTGCGICVQYCPTRAVEMCGSLPRIVRPQDCAYCGACEEICPAGAIALAYEIRLSPASKARSPHQGTSEDEKGVP